MAKNQKKPGLGMVGCGTPEVMFKERVRKQLSKIEGVVGIQVKKTEIVVRVVDQATADKLPKTIQRRPVVAQIVGVIKKQEK